MTPPRFSFAIPSSDRRAPAALRKSSPLLVVLKVWAVVMLGLSSASAASTAAVPATLGGAWETRHYQAVDLVRKSNPEVIFVGDSITHHWRTRGEAVWNRTFAKYRPANLGFGGDRTQHTLWRIRAGSLAGIAPKVVVLLIGTNNLGFEPNSTVVRNQPEEIVEGIAAIVTAIRRELPMSRILLLPILPRGEPDSLFRQQLTAVNAGIRRLHDGEAVHVQDIGSAFLEGSGRLPPEPMPDLLHPHEKGYEVFGRAIAGPLEDLWQRGAPNPGAAVPRRLNIGMIGLDTSHVLRFSKALNDPASPARIPGARIVFAFKGGSPDMDVSWSRVNAFEKEVREKYGVTVLDSIAEVVARSDAILIESVDGRVHLAQAREVFKAGKPVFIDKPFAGTLRDVRAIADLARECKTPVFGSSGLRFSAGVRKLQAAKLGPLRGAIAYGPAHTQPSLPDLYWYGVHAVEALYALMGAGCQTVVRTHTPDSDVVTGVWANGATGVVYGLRNRSAPHRVIAFGAKAVGDQPSSGDDTLLEEIIAFFRTGRPPVAIEETIELYAFMEAADESKRRGGQPVTLTEVMKLNAP